MQRCPYIHEMKERLLSSQSSNPDQDSMDKEVLEIHGDPVVGTVVKELHGDDYQRRLQLYEWGIRKLQRYDMF
ncbi:hypothetical protein C0J52_11239 [Blattella germanica]|nr:hypothetical protein C0J52_11239 [Blattella germanica]